LTDRVRLVVYTELLKTQPEANQDDSKCWLAIETAMISPPRE